MKPISKKQDYYLEIIFVILNISLFEEMTRYIFELLRISSNLSNYVSQVLYIIVTLYFLKDLLTVKHKKIIVKLGILIIFSFLYAISFLKYSQYRNEIFSNFRTFFLSGYLMFYFSSKIKLDFYNVNKIKPYIYISIILGFLTILTKNVTDNYMMVSYSILPSALLSFIIYSKTKKKRILLAHIILVIYLMKLENRGVILILILYYIYYFIFINESKKKYIMLYYFLSIVTIMILLVSLNNIQYNNRILDMIIKRSFFEDSSRKIIWSELIKVIKTSPLSIRGLYYDRIILNDLFINNINAPIYFAPENSANLFAHNWILEILIDFGIVVGGILIILIILLIVNKIANSSKFEKSLLMIFIIISFTQLMISSSFLINTTFWLVIGLCFNYERDEKNELYIKT